MLLAGPYGCRQFALSTKLHHCDQSFKATRVVGWFENKRSRVEHVRQGAGVIFRVWSNLRERHIACSLDKLTKLDGLLPACDPSRRRKQRRDVQAPLRDNGV